MVGPLLVSLGLYLGVIIAAYLTVVPQISLWFEHWNAPRILALLGANLVYGILLFFGSGILFLALAAFCCSMLFDRLSSEVEGLIGNTVRPVRLGCGRMALDTGMRLVALCAVSLIGFGCGWLFAGLGPVVVAALFSLWDYTAPFYLRRGVTFGAQSARAFRLPGKAGFMAIGGLLSLVPIVNVLMLPAMVAGGTMLACDGERRGLW